MQAWYRRMVKTKKFTKVFLIILLFAGFPWEEFCQFSGCFLVGKRRYILLGHYDHIMARWKQVLVAAEEFSNQSFHAIAKNGVTRFFCNGDAQTSGSIRVAARYCGKESWTSSGPLFINIPIAGFTGDFFRSPERLRFHDWKPNIPAKR